MGSSYSREGIELSDSGYFGDDESEVESLENYADAEDHTPKRSTQVSSETLDAIDSRLQSLKLKYPKHASSSTSTSNANLKNAMKLYLRIDGDTLKAKWVVSEKFTFYKFVKKHSSGGDDDGDDDGEGLNIREGF